MVGIYRRISARIWQCKHAGAVLTRGHVNMLKVTILLLFVSQEVTLQPSIYVCDPKFVSHEINSQFQCTVSFHVDCTNIGLTDDFGKIIL